jgi:hypothetical protein
MLFIHGAPNQGRVNMCFLKLLHRLIGHKNLYLKSVNGVCEENNNN